MKLGEDIRVRALLKEAVGHTPYYSAEDLHKALGRRPDVWIAVRLVCEALLGEENSQ